MTAQAQALTDEHSAFDGVWSWLQGRTGGNAPRVIRDVQVLDDRLQRLRARHPSLAGVELSPYVKNMVKMVGTMELIDPPSQRS